MSATDADGQTTPVEQFEQLWETSPVVPDVFAFLEQYPGLKADAIVEVLLVDQRFRHRRGCLLPLEAYLKHYPMLNESTEMVTDLVYGEARLLLQAGQPVDVTGYARRFPSAAEALRRQLDFNRWISSGTQAEAAPGESLNASLKKAMISGEPTQHLLNTDDDDDDDDDDDEDGLAPEQEGILAPLRIDDFHLGRELGQGGMGKVFEAMQYSLRRPVAIKILRHLGGRYAEAVARFVREARVVARLRHPHIVGVHGLGRLPDGSYFMVMDLIEGRDLGRVVAEGFLPVDDVVQIVTNVADAIDHAHQCKVLHRDLKPSNVLLDSGRRIVVTDFGLAKLFDDNVQELSSDRQIIGSLRYLSPEQADARRWGKVTYRTDVYGLGALLYALLTGLPPIPGRNWPELVEWLNSPLEARPLRELRPEISAVLEHICLTCLKKNPEERYPTVKALIEQLIFFCHARRSEIVRIGSATPIAELTVVEGEDLNRRFPLLADSLLVIGRMETSDTQLRDRFVSRVHCGVKTDATRVWAFDKGSKGGTFVNNQPISHNETELFPGDILQVGRTRLRLDRPQGNRNNETTNDATYYGGGASQPPLP